MASEDEIAQYKQAFDLIDADKSGTISPQELAAVLKGLGQSPTDKELQTMMKELDANGDGQIQFSEFAAYMAQRKKGMDNAQVILRAFQVFDPKKTGQIPVAEARRIFSQLGNAPLTPEDVAEVLTVASDGLNFNYTAFVAAMTD